ncbi:MAG: hypothetical protein KGQ59_08260 [Bdellovibrionales bacterium]|nr:hypothetical protein [Bdellovibrionales bacterium]
MKQISSKKKLFLVLAISMATLATLSGCNAFSLIDNPGGDEQYLSAARACFDQGDFDCARENYAKLSGNYAETRAAEEAFLLLTENGASMGVFMETFGKGGDGSALNDLAEALAPGSEAKRLAFQQAYNKFSAAQYASGSAQVQLVRYITSLALTAELLAENIPAGGRLTRNRIVDDGTSCTETSFNVNACDGAAGALGNGTGSGTETSLAAAAWSGTMTLGHFKLAMTEMFQSLDALAASGGFSTGSKGLAAAFKDLTVNDALTSRAFRAKMLGQGIGRP